MQETFVMAVTKDEQMNSLLSALSALSNYVDSADTGAYFVCIYLPIVSQ